MENIENTESKTVIKIQKNDGCFFTSSLTKPPTSRLLNQYHKNQQTLDTPIKTQARRSEILLDSEEKDFTIKKYMIILNKITNL